jgi:membrane protein
VYYSAQIFLFGADFTQVYTNRYGSGMKPAENAVRVDKEPSALFQDSTTKAPTETTPITNHHPEARQ